jgi:hypothetical protein
MTAKQHLLPFVSKSLGSLALAASLVLAGCAGMFQRSPEQQVTIRSTERWQTMMAKDFRAAYAYLSPYNRGVMTEKAYLLQMGDGSAWQSAEVVRVTCEQQSCKATVRIEVPSPVPGKFGGKIVTHIDENWIFVDGEWWYSQR